MTLANDIKETLSLGASYTILRESGNITGEYADIEVNAQVTKPFIREFFISASMPYDTQVVGGDVISFADGRVFIVMNKTPEIFENEIISYNAVFYKSNAAGVLYRPSQSRGDHNRMVTTWAAVKETCYALVTESLFGNTVNDDDGFGDIGLKSNELYIPHSVGVQMDDRYAISDSEYYKVDTVMTRRFDSVDVATIVSDTRGSHA